MLSPPVSSIAINKDYLCWLLFSRDSFYLPDHIELTEEQLIPI